MLTEAPSHGVLHPYIPGWQLGVISVVRLAGNDRHRMSIDIPGERADEMSAAVYAAIEHAPSHNVIGIDLRGILLMPSILWRKIGPVLHTQLVGGAYGTDKRALYLTGGDDEAIRNLQSAFRDASYEASQRAGKTGDRAALVPQAPKSYCGILRAPYEEVLRLVNQAGSLTNEELVERVDKRYSLSNANNYLTALADLGLVYRTITAKPTGGYTSRAFAICVPEEIVEHAVEFV